LSQAVIILQHLEVFSMLSRNMNRFSQDKRTLKNSINQNQHWEKHLLNCQSTKIREMKCLVSLHIQNTKLGCLMIHNQDSTIRHQACYKVHTSSPQQFNSKAIWEEIFHLQVIPNTHPNLHLQPQIFVPLPSKMTTLK
jgi:hypothetical protein